MKYKKQITDTISYLEQYLIDENNYAYTGCDRAFSNLSQEIIARLKMEAI
jgi:hypothetical protein